MKSVTAKSSRFSFVVGIVLGMEQDLAPALFKDDLAQGCWRPRHVLGQTPHSLLVPGMESDRSVEAEASSGARKASKRRESGR